MHSVKKKIFECCALIFFITVAVIVPFQVFAESFSEITEGWECKTSFNIFLGTNTTICTNAGKALGKRCYTQAAGDAGTVSNCFVCSNSSGEDINQWDTGDHGDGSVCAYEHDFILPGSSRSSTAIIDPEAGVTGEVVVEDTNAIADVVEGVANWMLGVTLQFVSVIVAFLVEILVWIFIGILSFISYLFTFVVNEFVIGMGRYVTSPDATAAREAWIMFRDLANIGIIAGLIATAIGTIIGNEAYNVQKNLARLILAALLVNFSYFVAGAIIDASNFTAKAAYEAVIAPPGCDKNPFGCGIAARFARMTNLTNALDGGGGRGYSESTAVEVQYDTERKESRRNTSASKAATFGIMNLIFIWITIFVFLSAISLLVARFVALIFLLVTSPIGIAGGAVPLLSKYSKEWWETLWSQAMFAPVYFLLVGISMNMLDQFAGAIQSGGGNDLGAVIEGAAPGNPYAQGAGALANLFFGGGDLGTQMEGIIGVIAIFTVAIGFMWVALSTAKKMSSSDRFKDLYGASEKAFGWMPKMWKDSTLGGAKLAGGMALRNTIGRAAEKYSHLYNEWAGKNQDSGRMKILKATGLDRAIKDALHQTADAKFGAKKGFAALKKERQERDTELGNIQREEEQYEELTGHLDKKGKKRLDDLLEKERNGTVTPVERAELEKLVGSGGAVAALKESKARKWRENELGKRQVRVKKGEVDSKTGKVAAADIYETDKEYLERQRERDKGHLWIKDPDTGEWRKEDDAERDARIAQGEELGRRGHLDAAGNVVWDEDYAKYGDRVDKLQLTQSAGGARGARERGEAIAVPLEETGAFDRKYAKDPALMLDFAEALTSESHLSAMKKETFNRKIKDRARELRQKQYFDLVEAINTDVKEGRLKRGSKEYKARTGEAYQYAQDILKNADEFVDSIKSKPFEHFREMPELQPSSLTGMYMASKKALGEAENRKVAAYKRTFLRPQEIINGINDSLGRTRRIRVNAVDPGQVVGSFHIKQAGGADRLYDNIDGRVRAEKELREARNVLDRAEVIDTTTGKLILDETAGVSREDYDEAKRTERRSNFTINPNRSSRLKDLRDAADAAYFAAKARGIDEEEAYWQGEEVREREIRNAKALIEQALENPDPRVLEDLLENDDLAFQLSEAGGIEGIEGAREALEEEAGGKNKEELSQKGWGSQRRFHNIGFAMMHSWDELAYMLGGPDVDRRFKESTLENALVLKSDEDILAYSQNEPWQGAMGSWPADRKVIDRINRRRALEYGPLFDPEAPMVPDPTDPEPDPAKKRKINSSIDPTNPNQRLKMPYSITEFARKVAGG